MLDNILAGAGLFGNGFIAYIVPFLFVLTIVVFFHELGHFLIARWCGVKVLVFSVGFGPELVGFNDRYATRWKLSIIPLGGYVKFLGDENAASVPDTDALSNMKESDRRVSFFHKPVRSRAAIVAAGPIANFILAIVIFTALFTIHGKPSMEARVDSVEVGSAAAAAGLQPGDVVLSIDGRAIDSFADLQRVVSTSAGRRLEMTVKRGSATQTLQATPQLVERKDNFGNVQRLGVLGIKRDPRPGETVSQPVDFLTALGMGAYECWYVVERTLTYIGGVVVGKESADQIGGPIRIAQVSGQVASISFGSLMYLAGILSVSIGLLNLFPVPLLDGGHLMFYAIEAIRGRPLSERVQEYGFRIGLALVAMLMIFATFNDLSILIRNLAPS